MRLFIALFLVVAMAPGARADEPRIFDIQYREGAVSGPAVRRLSGFLFLRVPQGGPVVLRWRSDEDIAVMLQGYRIETAVPAGGEGLMHVDASIAGRFAIEKRDKTHRTLLFLDIRPPPVRE